MFISGFPLHFEIGGTFGLIPYLYPQCVTSCRGPHHFGGGTSRILGIINPLQRVNGNAICMVNK